jgi:hypothetical protein
MSVLLLFHKMHHEDYATGYRPDDILFKGFTMMFTTLILKEGQRLHRYVWTNMRAHFLKVVFFYSDFHPAWLLKFFVFDFLW